MDMPIHYDLEAFERRLREDVFKAGKDVTDDFVRLQIMAGEVTVQWGLFLARMDNEEVDGETHVHAAAAVLACMIENVIASFEGDEQEKLDDLLSKVITYVADGGEVVGVTLAPAIVGGRA